LDRNYCYLLLCSVEFDFLKALFTVSLSDVSRNSRAIAPLSLCLSDTGFGGSSGGGVPGPLQFTASLAPWHLQLGCILAAGVDGRRVPYVGVGDMLCIASASA